MVELVELLEHGAFDDRAEDADDRAHDRDGGGYTSEPRDGSPYAARRSQCRPVGVLGDALEQGFQFAGLDEVCNIVIGMKARILRLDATTNYR